MPHAPDLAKMGLTTRDLRSPPKHQPKPLAARCTSRKSARLFLEAVVARRLVELRRPFIGIEPILPVILLLL